MLYAFEWLENTDKRGEGVLGAIEGYHASIRHHQGCLVASHLESRRPNHRSIVVPALTALTGGLMALLLAPPNPAQAEPLFSAQQCIESSQNIPWNLNDGDPIFLYVQADYGDRMSGCIDGTTNDGISNAQVAVAVQAAAEIWNREARSAVFRYGGMINASNVADACSQMIHKPAIFIRFWRGCHLDQGECDPGPLAWWNTTTQCANTAQISINGDKRTKNDICDDCDGENCTPETCSTCYGGVNHNQKFDGVSASGDRVKLLVHELGHVLNLGHPYDIQPNPSAGVTVMSAADSLKDRHLGPWDMDCADDEAVVGRGERQVNYTWKGYIPSQNSWNATLKGSATSIPITKGFTSGGSMRSGSSSYYAFYHPDHELWKSATVNSDGDISFYEGTDFSTQAIRSLYIAPHLMSPLEKSGGAIHDPVRT